MSLQDSLQKLNEIDISSLDINDIDFNNVGMWPTAGKVVVWLLIFTVVLVGSYQLNIKDKLSQYDLVVQKERTLRADFEKKVDDAANLEAYRQQMVEMEASFEALLKQLPKDTEVPALLDDITNKGQDSGLTFNAVNLQAEKAEEYYVELPIELNVVGGYHDLGSFVSGIAALPRIVTLGDFQINPPPVNARGGRGQELDARQGGLGMKITAKTFRYRSKEDGQ